MIRMVYYELYKAVRKRSFLIAVSCLLIINIGLLFYGCLAKDGGADAAAYRRLMKDIEGMHEQEKYDYIEKLYETINGVELVEEIHALEAIQSDMGKVMAENLRKQNPGVFEKYYDTWKDGSYLKYTDNLKSELRLIEEVYNEEQAVSHYKDYLKDISQTSSQLSEVSIFSSGEKSSFSRRNIKKTAEDYSRLSSVVVEFSPSRGFLKSVSSKLTDVLVILSILAFSAGLIFEEKEKGLYAITKSTPRGGTQHIAAKLAALFIYCIVSTALFYGCSLAFHGTVYGLGSPGSPLQSYAPFIGSALPITGLQYLLISYGVKAAVFFFIGMIILLLSILSKQSYLPAIVITAFLALCYGLTRVIPAVSRANWIKYLNPYGLLQSEKLYGSYINLNFFRWPVNCHKAAEKWLSVAIMFLCFCCIMCFNRIREMNLKEMRLALWLKKLSFAGFRPHTSLIRYEAYKIFIIAGAFPLLLVFGVFLTYNTGKSSYYVSAGEKRYASYMKYLKGPLTEEKSSYLESENDMYEEAMKQIEVIDGMEKNGDISPSVADSMRFPYESTLSFYGVFQRVWEKYQYIQSHPRAEFVYETGYMLLLGFSNDNAILRFLLLTVVLTLCLGNVYAMEYTHDMNRMISSTPRGRRRVSLCKLLISLVISVLCCIAVEGTYMMGIIKAYPLPGIGFPVTSIMAYSKLPDFMPLWAFIGIIAIVRITVSMASALIILLISRKLHTSLQGMFLSILVLGLSPILYIMGLPVAKWFGLLPLYMSPVFFTDLKGLLIICSYMSGAGIMCAACLYSLCHAFSGAASDKRTVSTHS